MAKKSKQTEQYQDPTNTVSTPDPTPEVKNEHIEENSTPEPTENMSECQEKDCEETEKIQQELDEIKDKYLRLSAEFDNYRKRTLREKQELISRAAENTLLKLLPVVDDFDLALKSASETNNYEAVIEGLEIIKKSLLNFLKNSGVQEIDAIGLELDTDFHDAITKMPAQNEEQKGKIIDIIKKGYLLNGNVIRHAQVIIGE